MDFGIERSVVSLMNTTPPDDDTHHLIRQLCTRAGMIMEDASAEAILWNGSIEALEALLARVDEMRALIEAARVMATASYGWPRQRVGDRSRSMTTIGKRIDETGTLIREDGGFVLRRDLGGRWKLDLHRLPVDQVEKRVRVTGIVVAEGLIDVDGVAAAD